MYDMPPAEEGNCTHNQRDKTNAQTPAEIGLDELEQVLLDVARLYFCAYTDIKVPHWERALKHAVTHIKSKNAPTIAISLLNVLCAMRTTRRAMFHYNSPYCRDCSRKVTMSESNLMRAIHYVRRDQREAAEMETFILCEGRDIQEVMVSINRLAGLLPAAKTPSRIIMKPAFQQRVMH